MNYFLSKVSSAFTCPKRYYWEYHKNLTPKEKALPLWKGAVVHDIISFSINLLKKNHPPDVALAFAMIEAEKEIETMPLDHKHLTKGFILNLWENLKSRKILESERIITFPVPGFKDTFWKSKLDLLEEDDSGLWIGEIKTTSSYTPGTLLKAYHKSIQPWIYLYSATKINLQPRGVRMFIVTRPSKDRPVPVYIEDIPLTPQNFVAARIFIIESITFIQEIEAKGIFYKNRAACINNFGECPFIILCDPKVTGGVYLKDLITHLFLTQDPENHLGGVDNA